MFIVFNVEGTRQLSEHLMFNDPWLGKRQPSDESVLVHPLVQILFARVGQRNALATTDAPQWKAALVSE